MNKLISNPFQINAFVYSVLTHFIGICQSIFKKKFFLYFLLILLFKFI